MVLTANYGMNNPAILLLREQGYDVRVVCYRHRDSSVRCTYFARKGELSFVAESGPELLGLATIWGAYGQDWNAQPDVMDGIITEEKDSDDVVRDGES